MASAPDVAGPSLPAVRRPGTSLRLGDLLVSEGLVTPAQVEKALHVQGLSKIYMPLGHILIAQKALTRPQLVSVLVRYRRSSRLGELLVKANALTAEQLAVVLAEQRRCQQALGEVALQLKYVTEAQVRQALCLQLHINFFDLDTITLDVSLQALINPRFARKHLVVPVARVGPTLVVAMDDPTRTALIDDLKTRVKHRLFEAGKNESLDAIIEELACPKSRRRVSLQALLSLARRP